MPKRRQQPDASRRNFLKGAGLVGAAAAAAVTPPVAANAMPAVPAEKLKAALPGPRQVAAETMPPANDPVNQSTSGGDFMIDVLKTLGIEYMATNLRLELPRPARVDDQLRRQQQARDPHLLARGDRGRAWRMATPRSRGKPMRHGRHGTVGLQHATMALYNAWCDRVPIYCMVGNTWRPTSAPPGVEWNALGAGYRAAIVRDYTKWDDQPASLQHFAEFDGARLQDCDDAADGAGADRRSTPELQEDPIDDARSSADSEAYARGRRRRAIRPRLREAARMLVDAENPGDRCRPRTPHAGGHGAIWSSSPRRCSAPSSTTRGRMNFPSRHPLNQSGRARDDRAGRCDPGASR